MGIASQLWAICIALSLFSLEASAARNHPRKFRHGKALQRENLDQQSSHEYLLGGAGCTVPLPPEVKAPKKNIWDHLSRTESHEVTKWLMRQRTSTYLEAMTKEGKISIGEVQLMTPNKTDVLQYLDYDGEEPARYASVVLFNATGEDPAYTNILVGPLPVSSATTWQPLTYPFTRKTPLRALFGDLNYHKYSRWTKNITDSVKDITNELWNISARHYDAYSGTVPEWQYGGRLTEWSQYWGYSTGDFDSGDLLPLGLYYGAEYDLYGREPSTWKFKGWVYNGIHYPTTEEFKNAYFSPGLRSSPNIDGRWTETDQKGPVLPLDDETPPMPVMKRARFSVDFRQKYVEWMGFSFYLSFQEDTGIQFHDIRFKGERIIYELGLQEALAHYAGNDPVQSGTAYLDSEYGLGDGNELMPGYDCPTYATYLNVTFVGSYSFKAVNSVCLFEFDADYPIQRHSSQSNTKNIYFVVRTITTVGNYDYMMSYEFYMDGSIQVVVRAAGYIQSAYYAKNDDYGYHIHDALSGSMHDHVLNFKADFDILGTSNTMELVTVTPTTENYVWSDQPRNTMKLVRQQIESEDESRLMVREWRHAISHHKYGQAEQVWEYRGYRILPSQGTVHLAATNSSNLVNAANWAYYDLAITKQKDTEPKSANTLNGEDVYEPLVNFDAFFDGESLKQEDLVLWFNLGVHHVPHTGDLPNTVFTTAHSAIQIAPSNYFLYDQSRDTVNMVRLDYKYRTDQSVVKTFGQAPQVCMANLSDYGGYY